LVWARFRAATGTHMNACTRGKDSSHLFYYGFWISPSTFLLGLKNQYTATSSPIVRKSRFVGGEVSLPSTPHRHSFTAVTPSLVSRGRDQGEQSGSTEQVTTLRTLWLTPIHPSDAPLCPPFKPATSDPTDQCIWKRTRSRQGKKACWTRRRLPARLIGYRPSSAVGRWGARVVSGQPGRSASWAVPPVPLS
jgi:hypothetical protein